MHAIFRKQFFIDVLLLAFSLFTSCGKGRREMATTKTGDAELRSSICKSKYYAYNLIANDSIMEGIAILDSLWETYHIDRTILVAIGTAYYKQGDKELAYQWFRRAEHHIDSLIDVEPSPGLYNDLLPVAYISKGKEAAMEVMDMMAEPEKSIAQNFFVEYPDRQTFLNEMVSMFDSCQYECLTQEDELHANEE